MYNLSSLELERLEETTRLHYLAEMKKDESAKLALELKARNGEDWTEKLKEKLEDHRVALKNSVSNPCILIFTKGQVMTGNK